MKNSLDDIEVIARWAEGVGLELNMAAFRAALDQASANPELGADVKIIAQAIRNGASDGTITAYTRIATKNVRAWRRKQWTVEAAINVVADAAAGELELDRAGVVHRLDQAAAKQSELAEALIDFGHACDGGTRAERDAATEQLAKWRHVITGSTAGE